jgi:hypothetical protein
VFDAYSLPTLGFGGGYRGCFGKFFGFFFLVKLF